MLIFIEGVNRRCVLLVFFFYLVSHLVPPVFIILQKFLLKIQIAKKKLSWLAVSKAENS